MSQDEEWADHYGESWTHLIDYCYGQAKDVLDHATQKFLADNWTEGYGEEVASLAEAWRDLGCQWHERLNDEAKGWAEGIYEREDEDAEETEDALRG
jgi:hypothetical protein